MQLTSLPSLDALKGFVAAARRKSITAAADDLCLTQSAISRQIQSLEERFGTPLFVRKHRSIALTDAGEQLYGITLPWMEKLAEFAAAVKDEQKRRPVTISASIGVSTLRILPRLGAFQSLHPNIDVRLAANNRLLDLQSEDIDLAIRYCAVNQAPPGALRLFNEVVVPVASPEVAAKAFQSTDSLLEHTLLEHTLLELDDSGRPWLKWSSWLRDRSFRKQKANGYLHFNQYDQVIQAALEGHGVALGRLPLVDAMLRAGRLVALSSERQDVPEYAYWLIDATDFPRPEVDVFRRWLINELNVTGESALVSMDAEPPVLDD